MSDSHTIEEITVKNFDLNLFPNQQKYSGKVRDVYYQDDKIVMIASDRISAFDHILPRAIPFKGQVLNQIAAYFLNLTKEMVPNWLESSPHPNVGIGKKCEPISLEMVVRGYLAGHAWREYRKGKRMICGVAMPDGMIEGDKFPKPIITPATKAKNGHDEDISKEEILKLGIVNESTWNKLAHYSMLLFDHGQKIANKQGLILVDTKYEFGLYKAEVLLMDEIHTPDSSRYYYLDGYHERQEKAEKQRQLSKEFVREWLMENGFHGKEGQTIPEMPDSFVWQITDRYIELYEKITGKHFNKVASKGIISEIKVAIQSNFINHE